jgi:putative SOS response-associated peptidase YedK
MTLSRRDLQDVADELDALYDEPLRIVYRPRYNVAPTDQHPVLRLVQDRRWLLPAAWGFAKPGGARGVIINARSETAAVRPPFRTAFADGRCVVPADGFYEWTTEEDGRRPIWFHRRDGRLLLLAGLLEEAAPGARRFTVLTTAANDFVRTVHDRMPAILDASDVDAWLREGRPGLLRPAPEAALIATPVSKRVNAVKNDDPACLGPPEEEPQQRLF